jgi:multicomponent K+:H+ antiporter subunit E
MRRWLPYPAMSAAILAAWLLLNQSLGLGQVLLGTALAIALGLMLRRLDLPPARIRRPGLLALLAARVLADIVRSNVAVARVILGGRSHELRSGFVQVPLLLTSDYGLAVLACIITSTPGTLWISYEPQARLLLVHVLDLRDEAQAVRDIVERYERPLREIFG